MPGEQPSPHLFEAPAAGEKENAHCDQSQRPTHLVEDVAEEEPNHGNRKTDDAQVHQRPAQLAHSPTDDEDRKCRHECVRQRDSARSGYRGAIRRCPIASASPRFGCTRAAARIRRTQPQQGSTLLPNRNKAKNSGSAANAIQAQTRTCSGIATILPQETQLASMNTTPVTAATRRCCK